MYVLILVCIYILTQLHVSAYYYVFPHSTIHMPSYYYMHASSSLSRSLFLSLSLSPALALSLFSLALSRRPYSARLEKLFRAPTYSTRLESALSRRAE